LSSATSQSSAPAWRSFAVVLVGAAALVFGALSAFVAGVDPYDTGRFAVTPVRGVVAQQAHMANASRARDDAFDAAVIGNSHLQLLRPERLDAATGLSFVNLTVQGAAPREQMAMLGFLIARRPTAPKALVIGIDQFWCTGEESALSHGPFPHWLYATEPLTYLAGLLRYRSLEAAATRLPLLVGRAPRARPDGYSDYTPTLLAMGRGDEARVAEALSRPTTVFRSSLTGRFPALELLRDTLRAVPPETAVVLVHPPVYVSGQPPAGSREAEDLARCKAAFADFARERPRTYRIDWATDRPETREPGNFFDHTHHKDQVARLLEAEIARQLSPQGEGG
jgi:hypothetical protein